MIEIREMTENDLNDVVVVENESFAVPWSKMAFQRELTENHLAKYFVAQDEDKIIGYIGLWHIVNEGHITNIAVLPDWRGKGIGQMLVKKAIEIAHEEEMIGLTLEVRISNTKAQKLYTKNGFKPEGIRKNYYSDPSEDAVIMWLNF